MIFNLQKYVYTIASSIFRIKGGEMDANTTASVMMAKQDDTHAQKGKYLIYPSLFK